MTHYADDDLLIHFAGQRDEEIERHLLACPDCDRRGSEARAILAPDEALPASAPLARFLAEAELVTAVASDSEVERFIAGKGTPPTLAIIKALLQRADKALDDRPSAAVDLTELALAGCASLSAEARPGQAAMAAVLGQAWKTRSHAYRLLSRYDEALVALDAAAEHYAEGAASDFELASVDLCRAGIYREIDRLAEGRELLESAKRVYARYGDRVRLAWVLLAEGAIAHRAGDFRAAAQAFRGALAEEVDRDTRAGAEMNLGQALQQLGDPEAAVHLEIAEREMNAVGRVIDALRARWGLARIALASGDIAPAATMLQTTRDRFVERGLAEEAGLASIDLIEASLLSEDHAGAIAAASVAVEQFRSAGLEKRTRVALAYLADAMRQGAEAIPHVRHVRAYLERAAADPALVFTPPS
jgi:tetratricopeptide (TPR) repeat protein